MMQLPRFLQRLMPARWKRRSGCDALFSARQGRWGEAQAERYLQAQGLRTVGRRVRQGKDEIDLILEPADPARRPLLVFVEVKTRSTPLYGGGRAAMTRRKRHALIRAVLRYLRRLPPAPFRIDLVEVYGSADAETPPDIIHHKAAVPVPASRLFPRRRLPRHRRFS